MYVQYEEWGLPSLTLIRLACSRVLIITNYSKSATLSLIQFVCRLHKYHDITWNQ